MIRTKRNTRRAPWARTVVSHSATCWYIGKKPNLCSAGDPALFANAWGKGPGSHIWMVFRCNCTRCPARVIVRQEAVQELTYRLLRRDERAARP